jgi:hypothetical protein
LAFWRFGVVHAFRPRLIPHSHGGAASALASLTPVSQALGLSSNTTIYIAGGKPHEVFEHSNESFDTTRALFPDSQFPKVLPRAPHAASENRRVHLRA